MKGIKSHSRPSSEQYKHRGQGPLSKLLSEYLRAKERGLTRGKSKAKAWQTRSTASNHFPTTQPLATLLSTPPIIKIEAYHIVTANPLQL